MKLPVTSGAVAVLGIVFGIPCLWAQNLGDIARQDRERRSRLSSHPPVLTNDDLARERILTPELKYRILTTQPDPGATASQAGEELMPPSPVTVSMAQAIRSSASDQMRPAIEVLPPAAVDAQTLPVRTQAYTEPAVAATAAIAGPVSLGEYARQLRAYRAARVNVQTPDATTPEAAVAAPKDDEISLGEFAQQLQLRHSVTEPIAIVARGPEAQSSSDAGQPASLGEHARQLRAVRSLQTSESASITPLPPRPEVRDLQPEISLGEYARQLRMQRAAEEYMRLLAQDDASLAASLAGDATALIRYHEIRSTAAAPSLRQRRVVAAVAAAKKNSRPAAQAHIAVTVRRGDSLWRLARTYLGSGARWQSISFLKRHVGSPDRIRVGEVILIPVLDGERGRASDVSTRFRKNLLPN